MTANEKQANSDSDQGLKGYLDLGFLVVLIAVLAVLVALVVTLVAFTPKDGNPASADVTAVLGIVATAITGMAGAFFGMHLGQQGKDKAEASKDKAQKRAEVYARHLDPAEAETIDTRMAELGLN